MAAIVARAVPMPTGSRSDTPPPHITLNTSSRGAPSAVPNKHIPICPPGPVPAQGLDTPPSSPPSKEALTQTPSLLYPPDNLGRQCSQDPPLYYLSADHLAAAIEHAATQQLPNAGFVFPWLHGLHKDNHIQLGFFASRRKSARKVPDCIRGIAIVKAGGDLASSRLKGAIAPDEILETRGESNFIEIDPREGFSVRNFQIQACKMATVSDIVVYGDDNTPRHDIIALAREISKAQRKNEIKHGLASGQFNTFILNGEYYLRWYSGHTDMCRRVR